MNEKWKIDESVYNRVNRLIDETMKVCRVFLQENPTASPFTYLKNLSI